MKATYRVLAALIPVLVLAQASFIALGLFGLNRWVNDGNALTKAAIENDPGSVGGGTALSLHFFGAMATALVALLLLVVSFFAKVDRGAKLAALIFGDVVLQWAFGLFAFGVVFLGALHAVNAFVLFGLGMMAVMAATRSLRGQTSSTARTSTTV
jgi:hypothetical protein